jgi:hypothetical protein
VGKNASVNAYQIPADPTAVVGRRIGAYVINAVILILAFFIGGQLADFKSEEIPEGFSSAFDDRSVCDIIEEDSDISTCFEINDTVYYTDTGGATFILWAPWLIVAVLNHIVLAGATGASVGKHIVGLRIVKKDTGQIAGMGACALRSVLWIVDAIPYCFPIVGLVTGLTTKGHRRVGDMAAGTLVVGKADVGRPPVVPGLTAVAMAPGYAPAGAPWAPPPAPTWGTPPPPAADPWGAPPPAAPAPDAWAPPPPAADAWAPPAAPAPAPSWDAPAAPEPTSAYPVPPTPAWEPPAETTALSTPEPEPPAPAWETPPATREPEPPAPAWEPRTVLAPEPEPEPVPAAAWEAPPAAEPEPEPASTAAAEETPGVGAPMWDAARNAYIQWDPAVGSWMQWDDAAAQWRPIS